MARPEIGALLALQQLDLEVARAQAEHEALTRALAPQPPGLAEVAYARARAALKTRREEQARTEAMLDDLRTRRVAQEKRLYSGTVAAKDLATLEREVAHLRTQEDAETEDVLARMEASEAAEQALAQAEQALRKTVAERAERQRSQRERLAALDLALADLTTRREGATAPLAPDTLERYEALRASHGGRALAEVSPAGVCQACRIEVSRAVLTRASTGSSEALCDNCGRMVYLASEVHDHR